MASLFEYFFGTGFWYVIIWLFFNSFMTEAVEANQWIGFYMITASVMKKLIRHFLAILTGNWVPLKTHHLQNVLIHHRSDQALKKMCKEAWLLLDSILSLWDGSRTLYWCCIQPLKMIARYKYRLIYHW